MAKDDAEGEADDFRPDNAAVVADDISIP